MTNQKSLKIESSERVSERLEFVSQTAIDESRPKIESRHPEELPANRLASDSSLAAYFLASIFAAVLIRLAVAAWSYRNEASITPEMVGSVIAVCVLAYAIYTIRAWWTRQWSFVAASIAFIVMILATTTAFLPTSFYQDMVWICLVGSSFLIASAAIVFRRNKDRFLGLDPAQVQSNEV